MRAVITNFGTTGDVVPLLALAVELRQHGHEPVMALSPNFASRCEQLGLAFAAIGPDLQSVQHGVNVAMMTMPDSPEQMRAMFAPLVSALPQMFDELSNACREADVLISGPMQPASRMVHEVIGIPFVSIQLAHFGGEGPPAIQRASAELINPFRARLGLQGLRNPLTIDANSPQLAIYAMSRHVRPPQADWPPHYQVTGFFFLDDGEGVQDPELREFIEAGAPPVVVTFGNMPQADTDALTTLVVEAVDRAGRRAVIPRGWVGEKRELPSHVYAVGYVSHLWLFPRAACVVHHGGGTAGAAFRSGVPCVFVPHGDVFDQHYWAELACELGCAAAPIPASSLTAERLGTALAETLTTPRYRQNAAALGERVRSEQGLKRARLLIEQLVSRIGLSSETAVPAKSKPESYEEREEKMNRRKSFQQMQRLRKRERPEPIPSREIYEEQ